MAVEAGIREDITDREDRLCRPLRACRRAIVVHPASGNGDVVAGAGGMIISAECKGGIINTRHPGQVSRL